MIPGTLSPGNRCLQISPNPATDKFSFDYIGVDIEEDFTVVVFDVNGRRLYTKQYYPTDTRVRETISTKNLPSGIYFVQFTNGAISKSRKLIITRH